MFISYIELENFCNFETGLGTRKLTIDFSKQTNPVCIITGDNGKGKTSLLSCMTPFATLGNLDVRDSSKLIIKKEEGHKLIRLVDDHKNLYEIEHFYHPTKEDGHTIKSYFRLNGEELNENGNVTSFKKLVVEHLELEMDYLKLIRMGDNIANLIKSKSTDRKNFMGKLLDSVNIYLKQHKELTLQKRDVTTVMSHLIDELNKTGVDDVLATKEYLKSLEERSEKLERKISKLEEDQTIKSYNLQKLEYPVDGDEVIRTLTKDVETFKKVLTTIDIDHVDTKALLDDITELVHEKDVLEISIQADEKERTSLINRLDEEMTNIHSLEIQIEKEKSELNLDSLKDHLTELLKKKNELHRAVFDELKIECTKEEFDDFVLFLKNTQIRLNSTYEIGKEPIKEVLKGMKNNEDIPNLITASLVAVEARDRSERMGIIDRLISRYSMNYDCKENCPYKNLHDELMSIKDARPVSYVNHDSEFYQMMKLAYENLSSIFDSFKEWRHFIPKLPEEIQQFFEVSKLFKKISNGEVFYDEKIINKYLAFFAEYDTYITYVKEYDETKAEIERMEKISRMGFLEEQKEKSLNKAENIKKEMCVLEDHITDTQSNIDSLNTMINDKNIEKDAILNFTEVSEKLKELSSKRSSRIQLSGELSIINTQLRELRESKDTIEREHTLKAMNLKRHNEIIKELDEKRTEYQDIDNILFAVSNKSGIPLVYIQMYLDDTVEIANELLDIVYHGSLYLKSFEIGEDSFEMPYVKNGRTIPDVLSASQGEQSFFNMAISSALRCQSLTNYNIALFDEVDSMFDDKNRQGFIPVLEKQLELNNVEQAFLITHNQMFHKYPVDIINLDNPEDSTVDVKLG